MKPSELIGDELDLAVAKCEGYQITSDGINTLLKRGKEVRILGRNSSSLSYSPSTNRAHGGPIIDRENISVLHMQGGGWLAETDPGHNDQSERGPTGLVAAMRCYVAIKLEAGMVL